MELGLRVFAGLHRLHLSPAGCILDVPDLGLSLEVINLLALKTLGLVKEKSKRIQV